MIYLYAITELAANPHLGRGLEDAEVRLAAASEVAALYSEHDRLDPATDPPTLWRHDQVVEAAMEAGATLPVRFGTMFADLSALISSLESEGAALRRRLDDVRGCVELAVRVGVAGESPAAQPAESGREYLESKLAEREHLRTIIRDTLGPLSQLAVRARHDAGRYDNEVLRASYLVRNDEVARFSDQAMLVAERNPQLWLSCTGPWPPYSFSEPEEDG